MAGRPRKDAKCSKHCVSLSPEAGEIIKRCGYQSNLSEFISNLILCAAEDSPTYLAIKIERLTKDMAELEEKLGAMRLERDLLQAQHNLVEKRTTGADDSKRESRLELLRLWDRCINATRANPARADGEFMDALGGPAYLGLIRGGGFQSPNDALAWCRSESRRR